MNNREEKLITLIKGNKQELKKWFDDFDSESNSINHWQKFLGYDLEPHSCDICHKIRNNIMTGLIRLKEGYKEIAEIHFKDAITYIEQGSVIREDMNKLYPKISKLLYPTT